MPVANSQQVPVNVVGSSTFGVYPKISIEKTVNLYISDGWLINYAGYQVVADPPGTGEGRGIFRSVRGGFLIAVIGNAVYKINTGLAFIPIGTLDSFTGEVSIDENLNAQICIVDGQNAYLYDYNATQALTKLTLFQADESTPLVPGYVTYHNTFFLFASALTSANSSQWYAFQPTAMSTTSLTLNSVMALQTKPDSAIAVERLPGGSNNVIVFGATVAEVWVQSGGLNSLGVAVAYQRVSSFSIDNGCVSTPTIAVSDKFVCWLGQNESNAPAIILLEGSNSSRISTDGIDHLLGSIKVPTDSTAFIYRENGHVFYQLTFFNPLDNLSLIYDFNTKQFFHVCDEKENFYPTRELVYFNENNYFISINDSKLYQMGQEFITYNYNLDLNAPGATIPRIRICKTLRRDDSSTFRAGLFTFWIEQGVNEYNSSNTIPDCQGLLITEDGLNFIVSESGAFILGEMGECFGSAILPAVDLSISKNGNQSFGSNVRNDLNTIGLYKNQIRWYRFGQANELTFQLRFWGMQRFCVNNGICEIY